jgi:hypothetical protein
MDTKLLTLSEAARACHKSHGTLRRLIEAGVLVPEPREDQNKRIFVSLAALNNAGLEILDEPFRGGRSYVADSEVDRLKAELEAAHGEIEALRRVRVVSTPPAPWLPTNPRRRSTDTDSDSLDTKRGGLQTK